MDKKRWHRLVVCVLALVGAQVVGQNFGAKQVSLCALGFCPKPMGSEVVTGSERTPGLAAVERADGR